MPFVAHFLIGNFLLAMTAQIAETLFYKGEQLSMCNTPLDDYFAFGGEHPKFESNCTALWRGYVGTWEIIGGRLYLVGLEGTLESGDDASLASVFPDFSDRVFGHWYSGTIRIPQGKLLEYVHMGYGSTYERDLFLEIEKGAVTSTRLRQNGINESEEAPEGYGIGGMTVFHRTPKNGEDDT